MATGRRKREVPRIDERRLVVKLWLELEQNAYEVVRDYRLRRQRLWLILRTLWALNLDDKLPTHQELARVLDVAPTTVRDKLIKLMLLGIVVREGRGYAISEAFRRKVEASPLLDRQINTVVAACQALIRIRKK